MSDLVDKALVNASETDVPDFLSGGDYVTRARSNNLAPEIVAGDTLIVRRQDAAEAGQHVLILVGEEVELTRFEAGMKVLGLVVGLMRRMP